MGSDNEVNDVQANSRRRFLGKSAALGLAGAGVLAGCKENGAGAPGSASASAAAAGKSHGASKAHVEPGQLDDYYLFSSGGHSGEARVLATG